MSVTLDGHDLFDRQPEIEVGSFRRDSVERAVAGLDGVLSIDIGGRGRKIKQTGVLGAKSRSQMDGEIAAISAYMDGGAHTLAVGDEQFDNLRMDAFKTGEPAGGGAGVVVDYEIVYTQLV